MVLVPCECRARECQHHLHFKKKKKRLNILLRFNMPPGPHKAN